MNFLKNVKIDFTPAPILNDDPQGAVSIAALESSSDLYSDINVAQALVDHLNEITSWKDKIDSLNYLSNQAEKSSNNPTYFTIDPTMINAIISIGGQNNGMVDLTLIKTAISLILEFHDRTAMNSLSGGVATNVV